jgi:flagellar hook-length control protein FliK
LSSVRSIPTGPSCSIESPASAPLAERETAAARFEQELGRESERVSSSRDEQEEPDADVAPAGETSRGDETAHDAEAPVEERKAVGEHDGEPLAADDPSAEDEGDAELAALEQLLQVVAGTPPPQPPTVAPNGGDAVVATEGTSAILASQGTLPSGAAAPAGVGARKGAAANGTAANEPVEDAPAVALEGEGESAAIHPPVGTTGEGEMDAGAFLDGGALDGGAAKSKNHANALDAGALPEMTTATLDPALAERLARELADARPIAATHAIAPTAATHESGAAASVARATATLAQLPALLDDGFVSLQRRDGRWEAEIRLDPPELGVVNVRLELDGGHLRVVARCDDRGVEQQLGQLFREWDEDLRKQGGEASFDLDRRAKEEERDATQARGERSLPPARAARTGRGVGPGAGLRIDLLA